MDSTTPSVHDEIAQGLKRHSAKKGLPFNLFVTAVEIGGSIALFHLARSVGASDVGSYLVGSIAQILGAMLIWAKARKFSGASAAIFAFTIVSAVIALAGSTAPKVLLYKDCAATRTVRQRALSASSSWGRASWHANPSSSTWLSGTARTAPMKEWRTSR